LGAPERKAFDTASLIVRVHSVRATLLKNNVYVLLY
jgi:hypothetical protein